MRKKHQQFYTHLFTHKHVFKKSLINQTNSIIHSSDLLSTVTSLSITKANTNVLLIFYICNLFKNSLITNTLNPRITLLKFKKTLKFLYSQDSSTPVFWKVVVKGKLGTRGNNRSNTRRFRSELCVGRKASVFKGQVFNKQFLIPSISGITTLGVFFKW